MSDCRGSYSENAGKAEGNIENLIFCKREAGDVHPSSLIPITWNLGLNDG